MKNIIFIGGINGSGKSTIGKLLAKKLGCPYFEGSEIIMNKLNISGNYTKLRSFPEKIIKQNLEIIFSDISQKNKLAIISGHYIKIIDGGFNVFDGNWFKFCKYNIHLVASPKTIMKRILQDEIKGRDRRLFNNTNCKEKILFLKKAQDYSIKSFKKISLTFSISQIIIKNNNKNEDLIVDKISILLNL